MTDRSTSTDLSVASPTALPMTPLDPMFDNGWWRDAERLVSPNCNSRPGVGLIDLIVIHSISLPPGIFEGQAVCDAHPYFDRLRDLRVSAHFVIWRDGRVTQFVPAHMRAWHAGQSTYRGRSACNDDSIGIELEGLEGGVFMPDQMATLVRLCSALAQASPIRYIAGHEHIAPNRKADPGVGFDWGQLQQGLAHCRLQWPATLAKL